MIDPALQQQIYISGSGEQAHAIFASGYNTPYSYQKSDYNGLAQQARALLDGKKEWMRTFIDRGSTSDYNRVKAEYDALGGDTAYQQLSSGQYSTDLISKIFPQLDRTQLNQFAAGQQVSSGYATDPATGNMVSADYFAKKAKEDADFAAGKTRKVPIGNGFGYVPIGSAADLNLQNPNQGDRPGTGTTSGLQMPGGFPASTGGTGNTTGGGTTGGGNTTSGTGLQMDYHQVIADTYASRPDLQALYGPDGRAINPNDPRVAGIPTILDWAAQYGVKENPSLAGFTRSWSPSGGGSGLGAGQYSTGDPQLDEILNGLQSHIDKLTANGQQFNPNIELTPEVIKQFLDQATAEVDPYYSQKIGIIRKDLDRNLTELEKSYQLQKSQDEADFKKNLGSKREQLAGAGLTFSGNRGAQEQAMVDETNRALQARAAQASSKAAGAITDVESRIGSRNLASLSMPNLVEYNASNEGMGGFNTARSLNFGTSGNITGDLEYDKNRDIRSLSDYLQSQEIKRRTLNF